MRPVSFVPMDAQELPACAQRSLAAFGFTAEEDVGDVFRARITEEKQDGRFYGINTVRRQARSAPFRDMVDKKETRARIGF